MSLKEARTYRRMPFLRRGMRADMDGRAGTITSGDSAHLRMRFDGETRPSPVHPTWRMTYFNKDGSIAKDYKQPGAVPMRKETTDATLSTPTTTTV